jgi:alpha-tubulin suppressor-like RCC1 family protein
LLDIQIVLLYQVCYVNIVADLKDDGRCHMTGNNHRGQLAMCDDIVRATFTPVPLDEYIIDVALGGAHSLFLTCK